MRDVSPLMMYVLSGQEVPKDLQDEWSRSVAGSDVGVAIITSHHTLDQADAMLDTWVSEHFPHTVFVMEDLLPVVEAAPAGATAEPLPDNSHKDFRPTPDTGNSVLRCMKRRVAWRRVQENNYPLTTVCASEVGVVVISFPPCSLPLSLPLTT